jgi:hypothetical protein
MAYVYVKCKGKAHAKIIDALNDIDGEEGLECYISCHGKDDFIESVGEQMVKEK